MAINKNTSLKEALELAPACMCGKCSHGCKMGSGMLDGDDAKNIAKFLKISEDDLKEKFLEEVWLFNQKKLRPKILRGEKAYGKCIFYDGKLGCKVHEVKPLQCKIATGCKDCGEDLMAWFTVNFVVDKNDAESIRQYSQYLKSGGKLIPGAELKNLVPDKEKLRKILSYEIMK